MRDPGWQPFPQTRPTSSFLVHYHKSHCGKGSLPGLLDQLSVDVVEGGLDTFLEGQSIPQELGQSDCGDGLKAPEVQVVKT